MLDPRAVDIMGDERDMLYTSDGKLTEAHLTVLYLTGSLASEMPAVNFGNTTNASSFTERLAGLMNAHPEVLVFANHPSNVQIISADDLLEAANANVLHVMEMERHAPLDITKWDYVLANLDDQAGDCNKIVWAICGHDMHYAERVDYRTAGAMLGMIPTVEQDPVYSDRRLAFADMIRRGSTVALAPDFRCGVPRYSLESLDGTAGSMNVSLQVDNIANASAVEMRFYGCDWETGSKPGTLLYSQRLTWDSLNSVTYHLTQTGEADGVPLTVQQKANIKYIRPVLAISNDVRTHSFLQPVRIKASGAWWDGPAVTLAGGHASVGPSPYPSGGTDTGIEIYFNTHSHTLNSDGDCAPSTVRRVYWDSLGMLDPTKPRFNIITDHNVRTPFPTPVSSVVVMREGVRLLGGFAGYETSVEQRDWLENPTVIDAQNQGRCIYSDGSCWTDERDAVIDGFILRGGNVGRDCGGALRAWRSSPTVRRCGFDSNQAFYGGAICLSLSSLTLADCVFLDNRNSSTYSRGGAMLSELISMPSILSCVFESNHARRGGAIFDAGASAQVEDCEFIDNSSGSPANYHGRGAALYTLRSAGLFKDCTFRDNTVLTPGDCCGGAIYVELTPSPTFERCTFAGNSVTGPSGRGAAVYSRAASPAFLNCVFTRNSAPAAQARGGAVYFDGMSPVAINNTIVDNDAGEGGAMFLNNCSPTVANNIIAFNSSGIHRVGGSPTLRHNDVYGNGLDYYGIVAGTGDFSADPLFRDLHRGNFRLSHASPCIDAGTASVTLSSVDKDGGPRVYGATVDIGAYEYNMNMFVTKPKRLEDGTSITWSGAVVTAVFQDFFYVGSDDRAYGIRVEPTPHGLQAGKRVEIRGTMRTDNERLIEADEVEVCGTGVVNPVFVANRSVGGGDYGTLTGVGQEGIAGASGLNNIGMLIRTTGRVTYACDDFFYIDDGSALSDGSGHVGIRVLPYGLSIPAAGSYVEVTGISSCFRPDGDLRRLIRATAIESF